MNPERDPKDLKVIGGRLKAARDALGLRQKDLYEPMGVSANTWHQWEAGKRMPDPLVMRKLKKLHGVSLDWIYDGDSSGLPDTMTEKVQKVAS